MNFHVRKLAHNTFDVFEGNQHCETSWSRLRAGRNGVYVAQGRSLPPAITKQLAANINPRLNMQEVSVGD
jgi:hypothetical protein